MKSSEEVKMKADLLLSLIRNLEDSKLQLMSRVHEKKNNVEIIETKSINTQLEKKVLNGDFIVGSNFTLPINNYTRVERSEHGVSFYFKIRCIAACSCQWQGDLCR
jgi:hypothetical protein